MRELTFARTRYTYDSYSDFWKLVELSEYPIVWLDEIDFKNRAMTYITAPFNGEFFALAEGNRKCKVLLWNLERPAGSGGLEQYKTHLAEHMQSGFIDGVIVSDITLAKETGFKYVPIGSHTNLGLPGVGEKSYDFIHLMCYSNRRAFLFPTPESSATSYAGCSIAPNGWGEERHARLRSSKFMLNVHQDEDLYIEPLRFALAAAYGLPILTENLYADSYPYTKGIVHFPLRSVSGAMRMARNSYDRLFKDAQELRDRVIGAYTFRRCIERFLWS